MRAFSKPGLARPATALMTTTILIGIVCIHSGCKQERTKEEKLKGLSPHLRRLLDSPMHSTPLMVDGIESPRLVSSDQADLDPNEEVIGVVVEGQARAYPLLRMRGMADHVVNDCVTSATGAPQPFTVTYCDRTDCVRVIQADGDRTAKSMEVGTLGLLDGELALRWQGRQFKQNEQVAGLSDLPHQRMTWHAWRCQHPETQVYAGPQRPDTLDQTSPSEELSPGTGSPKSLRSRPSR